MWREMGHDGDSDGFLSAGADANGGLRTCARQHRWALLSSVVGICGMAALSLAVLKGSDPAVRSRPMTPHTDEKQDKVGLIPEVHIASAVPPVETKTIESSIIRTPPVYTNAKLWQTARDGGVWEPQADVRFVPDWDTVGPVVDVFRELGQSITGFGGAFTEASALVFSRLGEEQQKKIMAGYFGAEGLGYTVGRVHINSCDFSASNYAFDDTKGDLNLTHFDDTVAHDQKALIPFIIIAQDMLQAQGKQLSLLATPWSPPAWMKTNGMMDHSLHPCLHNGVQATWANYITRWVTAYKTQGVPIWGITIQNEPENDAVWESCLFTPQEEADFLGTHLGPTLKRKHPEVLIFVFDHNKDHIYRWADILHSHPEASQHVDGVAFHWYSGDGFDAVQQVHTNFPDTKLLATEATYERRRWRAGATLETGEWSFGEGYAHDIIGDLNAGSIGWIDWNLMLDENGGPNHANNDCDAAIIVDLSKGGELFFHPQYYFMGHFSRYIVPGSRHLRTTVSSMRTYTGIMRDYGTCAEDDGLQATSFLRPDGFIAVVALNCGDNIIGFKLRDGARAALVSIPPHAIQTYLLDSK